MKKMKTPYFVIFAAMRTGSNLLEKTLDALGDTACYGEAFNPGFMGKPKTHTMFGWTRDCRDTDPQGFLTMLRGEAGGKIPGFRYFEGHLPDLAPHLMRDPACRRIILRRDPLASYLSLKAARETGQWMLRNAHRRMAVKVRFDAQEFEAFRERLTLHYAWLDSELQAAGTDALRLTYEDLLDQTMLWRVVNFIGSKGEVPLEQPIIRQNPGPLCERVLNYEEMCAWLGMHPEPRTPPPLPDEDDVLFCRHAPLAAAPIDGPGGSATLSLLYRLELREFGGTPLSHGQLLDAQARQSVFASGYRGELLRDILDRRELVSLVCHPATRLHSLFLEELFGRGWHGSAVRRHLVEKFGGIPSPKEMSAGSKTVEQPRHLAMFVEYLSCVAEALDGGGVLSAQRNWYAQADLLARYKGIVRVDRVGLLEDLDRVASMLARDLGLGPLPPSHVRAIADRAVRRDLPIDDIATPDVLNLLRRIHGRDFANFGYGDWPFVQAAA
ncbi:MAG: hypothetical protein AAGH68_02725 [Pseudomonadota bacterium]